MVSSISALDPGAVLGGYQIDGVIAQGGMGLVYMARDLSTERRVWACRVRRPQSHLDRRQLKPRTRQPAPARSCRPAAQERRAEREPR